ncbi:MAG: peptide chain release factor N(5)-glutamine methyltransferase [Terasakiella sp.]|uniref:peptide chain release factor N(5)-glutamine methyltransferase n=1 Tax=unclassified Terasakiella TaxID=2614952 RepID=UPI003B001318
MTTIANAMQLTCERLEKAGIENARFEARLLLCHVLGVETQILIGYPERDVSQDDLDRLEVLLRRREGREPMSHILGEREFWSLPFKVTKDTLTPRPDSETLIESVLRYIPDTTQKLRVLDLGTGTGCLLLTVLSEYQQASGLGVDISSAALDVAKENARNLGLEPRSHFRLGNWGADISEQFDLILSNPPYIALMDKETLAPEVVQFEPDSALFAGLDGLDDYRKLALALGGMLCEDGLAVLEIGINQGDAVSELMEKAGLYVLERPKDLSGIERCVIIRKKL